MIDFTLQLIICGVSLVFLISETVLLVCLVVNVTKQNDEIYDACRYHQYL